MLQLVPSCAPVLMTERWTVLIVEDEPILRDLMRRILEKRDYRVLVAENGANAVDIARAHTEGIDLLITDIVMPGVDGFDVADQLTEIHPMLRVLFLTGYAADSEYVHDRLESDDGALLRKPFSQTSLIDQIEDLFHTPSLRLV
jgi:YesN/AraC family two-component response regulator